MIHLSNKYFKLAVVAGIGLLGLVSCSVKEDRTYCPCYLEVSFTDREHIADPVGLVGWSMDRQMFDVRINTVDYPDIYIQPVEKCMLDFGAIEGVRTNSRNGRGVTIPLGQQCDSLYAYHEQIDCTGELAKTTVQFHKQFATVYLNIGKSSSEMKNYSFIVNGNSCGFDILTFEPIEGAFTFTPTELNGNVIQFRLPRQLDNSLTLSVGYNGNGNTFNLGEFIARIGYNWNAEDLQDIFITLDIVNGKISVGVADWENAEDFELSHVDL